MWTRRDEESLTAHVSNDNPFSEAAFKTLKYCRRFPTLRVPRGRSVFCEEFFTYYNHEHDTPALVCTPPVGALRHALGDS